MEEVSEQTLNDMLKTIRREMLEKLLSDDSDTSLNVEIDLIREFQITVYDDLLDD